MCIYLSKENIQIYLLSVWRTRGGNLGVTRGASFYFAVIKDPGNHTVQCSPFTGLKGISNFTKDTQLVNDRAGMRNLISLL
jgi:hypothetical protein